MFDRTFVKMVRDQHSALDKEIVALQKKQEVFTNILKLVDKPAAPAKKAAKPATATTTAVAAPASTNASGGPHKGYITTLLPFLFERSEVAASAMLTYLQGRPGLANVKRNSLDAAIQNELKKGANSRVERVRPGVYKISEAGTTALNGGGQPSEVAEQPAPEAEQPQAEPEVAGVQRF